MKDRSTVNWRARVRAARLVAATSVICLATASVVLAGAPHAWAANLSVTRFDDPAPNGCQPADCSLREAIIDANASPAPDTITLAAGAYVLSRSGVDDSALAGDLDLQGHVTIVGAGQGVTFIDANGVDRGLDVANGATVAISGLSLIDGVAAGFNILFGNGASGGGVRNAGDLTMTNATVQNNEGGPANAGISGLGRSGSGGGIFNSGTLDLVGVTIKNNRAGTGASGYLASPGVGGAGGHGGGIYNSGSMTATESVFIFNAAGAGGVGMTGGAPNNPGVGRAGGAGGHGGALYNAGTAIISASLVSTNQAGEGGEGGYSWEDTPGGGGGGGSGGGMYNGLNTTQLLGSTVTANSAGAAGEVGGEFGGFIGSNAGKPGEGGGAYVELGQFEVSSSTLAANTKGATATGPSFNTPQPADVAGIEIGMGASAVLTNATVSGHAAGFGVRNLGTLVVTLSTFTGNGTFTTQGVTSFGSSIIDDDWAINSGNFTSLGYSAATEAGFPGDGSDVSPANVNLGPLLVDDLPPTHPLLSGSEAIDLVPEAFCSALTDARGVARPQGTDCDAGAYELMLGDTVGLVDISQGLWYLRNEVGVVTSFGYGNPGDLPIAGDWDGDGDSTPGLYRQSDGFFYSRDSNSTGIADAECFAGNPEDVPIAGDWDGDGDDNLGIYRPSIQTFFLFTSSCTGSPMGAAQISFLFGNPGDKPVSGDWDADGIDEVGLHRESTGFFYWRETLTTGVASGQIFYGDPNDRFVSGDWGTVDGVDSPAIFRPSSLTFYFRHSLTQGVADSQFTWASAGPDWLPVAGTFGLD